MKPIKLSKIWPWLVLLALLPLLAEGMVFVWKIPDQQKRDPGMDVPPGGNAVVEADLSGPPVPGPGQPADLPGSWPRFRGANLDNISTDALPISSTAPATMWSIAAGEGYAGPAVYKGRVYLLDYDAVNKADVLRCLSLADGKDIWTRSYPVDVKRNHGMSRAIPTVTDQYVITLGPKCDVACVDTITGNYLWGIDLVAKYHAKIPPWYAAQCPLIDGQHVILAPGGDALMLAVDCPTGKVVWKTPNPGNWDMTHSSIVPMTFNGQHLYIYCGSGGVVGVSADDGSVVFRTTAWKVGMATVPTPLIIGEDRIFLCGGYGAGALMLQLKKDGATVSADVLYKLPATVFGSEQQTPIYYNGYIYGVVPAGPGLLVCLNPADGKIVWDSGTQRFGSGPYILAHDMLLIMNDTGTMTAVKAATDGYHQVAKFSLFANGHESWGPMALAGPRLIARDFHHMACFNFEGATAAPALEHHN